MSDAFTLTILDDGRVKIETEGFSAANHAQADEIERLLEEGFGGEVTKEKSRAKHHKHSHNHQVKQR